MQLLQQTWNNYRSYRTLQDTWTDFISVENMTEQQQEYETKLNHFLESFINIAWDQIRQPIELTQQKGWFSGIIESKGQEHTTAEPNTQSGDALNIDSGSDIGHDMKHDVLSQVFSETKSVLEKICQYLDYRAAIFEKHISNQINQSVYLRTPLPLTQSQLLLFQNCMEAIKIIIKDKGDLSEFENYERILESAIKQFKILTDAPSMKALLILIQTIFQCGKKNELLNIRVTFARKNGFHEALKQLLVGDINYRKYIRAFFRQNLTYQTTTLVKQEEVKKNEDPDSDSEVLLQDQGTKKMSKWQKFIGDKIKNIKQENIEDFFCRQDSHGQYARYSMTKDSFDRNESEGADDLILQARDRSMSYAMRDNFSDYEYENANEEEDNMNADSDLLPSKSFLEKMLSSDTTSNTAHIQFELPDIIIKNKQSTDNLNKVLREMYIFETFGNLISQANLESLLELIHVLKFMVNFDKHNTVCAKEALIYEEITKAFKRLIKYGQIQEISQKVVIDCFLGLLKMSIATKLNQSNNAKIKNSEAFICSLACVKILLKSKTQNNYIECLNSLYLVIKENIKQNSIQFQKLNGFSYVQKLIECLLVSKKPVTEANYTAEYLSKVLDLSGLIAHVIGDLDQMPLSNEIVTLIMNTTQHQKDSNYVQKRELLINFIMSQIDDKNLRLDLQRKNVTTTFDDITNLALNALKLFRSDINSPTVIVQQNVMLLLKLLKYQIDANDRNNNSAVSILGEDFDVAKFLDEILTANLKVESFHAQMVYLASQVLTAQQFMDHKLAATIFSYTLKRLDGDFKETFACLYLSPKYNIQSYRIKKCLTEQGEIKVCFNLLTQSIHSNNIDESLMLLHLLVLMTQGCNKAKTQIEEVVNSDELMQSLLSLNIDKNDQLFILRCLIELSSDKTRDMRSTQIYQNALDSCFVFMNYSCREQEAYDNFEKLFLSVQQLNSFIQKYGHQELTLELKNRSRVYSKSRKYSYPESIKQHSDDSINQHAQIKPSQFLNIFFMFLFQSDSVVQIKVFEDLTKLLHLTDHNKSVVIDMGLQDIMLQIIYKLCYQYKMPNNSENKCYIEALVDLVQKTLELGVKESYNSINDIVLANQYHALTRNGKKLTISVSHQFIKALIETLKQPSVQETVSYDVLQRLDHKFDKKKQYITLVMKLQGNFQDETLFKKLMTLTLFDQQFFSIWISRGKKLQIKLNDQSVLKEISFIELQTNFEFNVNSFNKYQMLFHNSKFILLINDKIVCKLNLPLSKKLEKTTSVNRQTSAGHFFLNAPQSFLQPPPGISPRQGPTGSINATYSNASRQNSGNLAFNRQRPITIDTSKSSTEAGNFVRLTTFQKIIVSVQNSFVCNKLDEHKKRLIPESEVLQKQPVLAGIQNRIKIIEKQRNNMNNFNQIAHVITVPLQLYKPYKVNMRQNNHSMHRLPYTHKNTSSFKHQNIKLTRASSTVNMTKLHSTSLNSQNSVFVDKNQVSFRASNDSPPITSGKKSLSPHKSVIENVVANDEMESPQIIQRFTRDNIASNRTQYIMGKMQLEIVLDNSPREEQEVAYQSLKSYLSQMQQKNVYGGRDNTLKLLLNMIDQCQDKQFHFKDNSQKSEQNGETQEPQDQSLLEEHKFTTAFTLLANLLIQNDEVLETFNKMDGLNQLLTILEAKMATLNDNSCQTVFNLLTQIFCNDLKANQHIKALQETQSTSSCASQIQRILIVNEPNSPTLQIIEDQGKQLIVPQLLENKDRLGFLHLTFQLTMIKHVSNKTINIFLEQLITLIQKSQSNLAVFRNNFGFKQVVLKHIFGSMILAKPQKYRAIYETSLKLFEVFVQAIKNETSNCNEQDKELSSIFDFILSQDFKEATETTSSDEIETAVKVSIDMLTIIFLHIVISKQTYVPPSSNNGSMFFQDAQALLEHERRSNPLLAKVLKLDTFNIIMSLIKVDNLHLREHTIKVLQLLIFVSDEFKQDFKHKLGFKLIAHLIKDSRKPASFNLCHTILNAILQTYDNPNDFRPVNNALVQQVMNKSLIAREIVNQTNVALNKPKKSLMINFDLFEMFFQAVSLMENDKGRIQMLKVLLQYFSSNQNDQNMAENAELNFKNILEHHFEQMVSLLFKYVKRQNFRVSDLLDQAAQGSKSSQKGANDGEDESSDDEEGFSDPCAAELDDSFDQLPLRKNKSIEFAIDIMIKIVIEDLKRTPDKSKTFEFLKNFDSCSPSQLRAASTSITSDEDSNFLQFLIVIQLLNHFCENPKVQQEYGDGDILVNLNLILSNLDQIMPYNPIIIIKSLKLINSLAFKNSMDVRRQMKYLKMFELRDNLIMLHLINVSELLIVSGQETDGNQLNEIQLGQERQRYLLKSVCEFSYDVVASKASFKEGKGACIVVLTLMHFIQSDPSKFGFTEQEEYKIKLDLLTIVTRELLQYNIQNENIQAPLGQMLAQIKESTNKNVKEEKLLSILEDHFSDQQFTIPEDLQSHLSLQLDNLKLQNHQNNRKRFQSVRTFTQQANLQQHRQFQEDLKEFKENLTQFKEINVFNK